MVVMALEDEDGKGSNKFSYCTETKTFILSLSLAFFGMNLKFISGKPPPAPPEEGMAFDIVTLAYVNRNNAVAWTRARARAHFGEI